MQIWIPDAWLEGRMCLSADRVKELPTGSAVRIYERDRASGELQVFDAVLFATDPSRPRLIHRDGEKVVNRPVLNHPGIAYSVPDLTKYKKWLFWYSVMHDNGDIEEEQDSVLAADIFEALGKASERVLEAVEARGGIVDHAIWDIGIVDDADDPEAVF